MSIGRINTNTVSLRMQHFMSTNTKNMNEDLLKLSSGHKINKAADDSAGLHISEKFTSQIRGLQKSIQGIQDGINVLQVAEGSLSTMINQLQRIRELAVQAGNDTYASTERLAMVKEVSQRIEDIDRIAKATKGGNTNLLDGSATKFKIQSGAESDETVNTIDIGTAFQSATASSLGFDGSINITAAPTGVFNNGNNARSFIGNIDNAIAKLINQRSVVGSLQNRLNSSIASTLNSIEKYTQSRSTIKDTNVAITTSDLTLKQLIKSAATSVMSQANHNPESALALLHA